MSKFYIFSTERGASTTPNTLSPAPTTLIKFDRDPIYGDGEYNPEAGSYGRASITPTFGGAVIQEFTAVDDDIIIEMSDVAALSGATVSALTTAYNAVETEYYFTDGYNCWKFRFAKPEGFKKVRNLSFAHHSISLFSYSLKLWVTEKAI